MWRFSFLFFLVCCSCNKFIVSGEPFDKDEFILGFDEKLQKQKEMQKTEKTL